MNGLPTRTLLGRATPRRTSTPSSPLRSSAADRRCAFSSGTWPSRAASPRRNCRCCPARDRPRDRRPAGRRAGRRPRRGHTPPCPTPSPCCDGKGSSSATESAADPPSGSPLAAARSPPGLTGWDRRLREQLADLPAESKATTLRFLLDLVAGLQRSGAITVARMCSTCRFFGLDAHPGAVERHHCALVDMPMSDSQLRVDCAEHERGGLNVSGHRGGPSGRE